MLIHLLFETGLRSSKALQITLRHLELFEGRPVLRILGKGHKPRLVACPRALAANLQAYAYRRQLSLSGAVVPINHKRAHQIISEAGEKAGLIKKVYPPSVAS